MKSMPLTELVKNRILEYNRRGYPQRTICKLLHLSLRDVSATIKAAGNILGTNPQQTQASSPKSFGQHHYHDIVGIVDAFKEFEKGTPLEKILIKLEIEDPEQLKKWYFSYLDLKGLGSVRQLYDSFGGSRISIIAERVEALKNEGVSEDEYIRRLKDNRELPGIRNEAENLRREKAILEASLPAMRREYIELKSRLAKQRKLLDAIPAKYIVTENDIKTMKQDLQELTDFIAVGQKEIALRRAQIQLRRQSTDSVIMVR